MLRYTTDRARPGLVALYDIRPGNGAGQFLQPRSPQPSMSDMSNFVPTMPKSQQQLQLTGFGRFSLTLN